MFDKLARIVEILYSLTIITICIYINRIIYPYWSDWICIMETNCNKSFVSAHVKTIFPRTVAIVCLVSRMKILLHQIKNNYTLYGIKVDEYETYFPNGSGETRAYKTFVSLIVFAYALIVLPTNVTRVYLVYSDLHGRDYTPAIWFILLYVQNWDLCSTEMQFVARCFGLCQKFRRINDDMTALRSETIFTNRYPLVLQLQSVTKRGCSDRERNDSYDVTLSPHRIVASTTASRIELLRMRHQFVRDVFRDLNDLYGVQLALSLCALFLMTLTVSYGEYFRKYSRSWYSSLFYVWLLQFFFRFCSIVLTAHFTTKQVYIRFSYYIGFLFIFFRYICEVF